MTVSTLTLTPDTHTTVPGVGVSAEQLAHITARATRDDYSTWLRQAVSTGGCARPIRLAGTATTVDTRTGEVLAHLDTTSLPDAVLYTACGNRRSAVCPTCAETYRADTFHLIRAGIAGNPDKHVPTTVAGHPCLFVTFTAPSFGPVHTQRRGGDVPTVCHRGRKPRICPHGVDLCCPTVHADGDELLGRPLCLDCYDHPHHVVWNHTAGELWRRTTIAIRRHLDATARRLAPATRVRLSYGKVAEYQARGAVHFHALIRIDGFDPDRPDELLPPPAALTAGHLEAAVCHAHTSVWLRTDPHPANLEGWDIRWGGQLDVRTVRDHTVRPISTEAVAGYLAKYATKATETTGHLSERITRDTITIYGDQDTHTGRLVAACWTLGRPAGCRTLDDLAAWKTGYGRLRRWAHMLGYGGHFTTKSRRYAYTLTAERARRATWRRRHPTTGPNRPDAGEHQDHHDTAAETASVVVGTLTYAGTGWHTTADALLATTAAAQARERRRAAREQLAV